MSGKDRIVFPLDVGTIGEAEALAKQLAKEVGVFKVGLELFIGGGHQAVETVGKYGLDIFLDLKLHDIPETVARAVANASFFGVKYLTVHASGGRAMLERAVAAAGKTTLLAVTVLTSFDDDALHRVGVAKSTADQALFLASLAWEAGIRGFVCSPLEVRAMRERFPNARLVVPGVRPLGAAHGDQRRVATPAKAISDGADLLVIGRPIRDAADPIAAARAIAAEIGG